MRARTETPPARRQVAANVRAELARAGVSQATAAAWIGVTQPAMSARLHARVPFTVDEAAAIADGLGLPLATLVDTTVAPFPGRVDRHTTDEDVAERHTTALRAA